MELPEEGCILRIFTREGERCEGQPLYEWLLLKAREDGLAGATALRGMTGFGTHGRPHGFKIGKLEQDQPIVIEFVDRQEKLEHFLKSVTNRIGEALVTLQEASVRFYRARKV